MSTISEKLTYLNDTRLKIKDDLNKFGSNITENDTFRSYSNVLNDIYDKLPKVSGNGTDFALENAQNGKLDSFGMDGNTEQATYSGKNLCSSAELQSAANIRFYIDKKIEKTLTISFTTNERLNTNSLYLSATDTLATTITADANTKATATFTLSDEQYSAIQNATNPYFLLFKSGANFTVPNDAQIENGSTATSYEPYVGGTPSPNPDYPQEVKVVENEQIVNVHGKNLFDGEWSNGSIGSNGQNISDSKSIRTTGIGVKSGVQYTFSSSTTTSINEFWINYYNGDTFVSRKYLSSENTQTFIVPSGVNNARFRLTATTDIDTNIINNVQLEQGSTATTYEPYQINNYTLNLGTIELCKIEDYKDVIFKNNQLSEHYDSTLDEDSWYIKKNIGKVVLDTSNITLRSNYTNIEYAEITKPNDFIGKGNYDDYNVYCSHAVSDIKNAIQYAWDSTYRIGKITNKATTDNLWLGFPKGTGLDNIKTALNGAVVYYVLSTPTYEKITNSTLISQLESIETFTGLNYFSVSNENNVLPTLYVSRLKELGKLA